MFELTPYFRSNRKSAQVYDPFREMEDMERRFFGNSVQSFRSDIKDEGNAYLIETDMPGFRKEDISLTIKEDVLTIAAHREEEQHVGQYVCRERRAGDVRRSFDVSAIQQEGIRAAFENGVLVLTLPKASAVKPERRSISIQ